MVSKPIIQFYYTQLVGDAQTLPVLKASSSFAGMAVIDSDPYTDSGDSWYTNQNNFFRAARNFVIDLTELPQGSGAGVHWQVGQATSLQNIQFIMVQGGGDANKQVGVFMDNGSGGFMSDLSFSGGNYGMFLGNQQFTTRNLTFNNCNTAIFMNWNWAWTFKSLNINNCGVGLNMSNSPENQTVGSVMLLDSTLTNTPTGVVTAYTDNSAPVGGGALVLENVDFSGSKAAVVGIQGNTILNGGSVVPHWLQGNQYAAPAPSSKTRRSAPSAASSCPGAPTPSNSRLQGTIPGQQLPDVLMDGSKVLERSKPLYEGYAATSFISVKSGGAKGDGQTDDTVAIQKVLDSATADQVVYFDHGAYVITSTIKVPKNIRITGEIWPVLMASGDTFSDQNKPVPMLQIGQSGDTGSVELSDLMLVTKGPAPGAILVEWNVGQAQPGSTGMWDVHFRVGGAAGTGLQSDVCGKNPTATDPPNPKCIGAFMLLHITEKASAYIENSWAWTADHELDLADHNQIDIYTGRGILIEGQGPNWLYGTAAEHNQLYNYQVSNAQNVFMGFIQSETPYYQSNPNALTPFQVQSGFNDPDFSSCTTDACRKSWGLRVANSSDLYIYGAGLYSFFDNFSQSCLDSETCQENMVEVDCSHVSVYGLSTKASNNMVTSSNGNGLVLGSDNLSNFCSTISLFQQ